MVFCAQEGAPPPPELNLAWLCERWVALPDEGGIYDQDAQLISRMTAASNVYKTIVRIGNLHGEQIHNLSNQERDLLNDLRNMGLMYTAEKDQPQWIKDLRNKI